MGNETPLAEEVQEFLDYLSAERSASAYTIRNYRQTLVEFDQWYRDTFKTAPDWIRLKREDFRSYLRHLGAMNLKRAPISLRFSALRSFYKFLIRRGILETTPIKDLSMPKQEKRLPRFLTVEQTLALLDAPFTELKNIEKARKQKTEKEKDARKAAFKYNQRVHSCWRDQAILETFYS
ncbi:MAG: site-specific integrase, partial [Verrucomicrobia bacterium]|nr:site-specific integrase [Verrucomicrobiota bacterium]